MFTSAWRRTPSSSVNSRPATDSGLSNQLDMRRPPETSVVSRREPPSRRAAFSFSLKQGESPCVAARRKPAGACSGTRKAIRAEPPRVM